MWRVFIVIEETHIDLRSLAKFAGAELIMRSRYWVGYSKRIELFANVTSLNLIIYL